MTTMTTMTTKTTVELDVELELEETYRSNKDNFKTTIYGVPITTAFSKEALIGIIIIAGEQERISREMHESYVSMRNFFDGVRS